MRAAGGEGSGRARRREEAQEREERRTQRRWSWEERWDEMEVGGGERKVFRFLVRGCGEKGTNLSTPNRSLIAGWLDDEQEGAKIVIA